MICARQGSSFSHHGSFFHLVPTFVSSHALLKKKKKFILDKFKIILLTTTVICIRIASTEVLLWIPNIRIPKNVLVIWYVFWDVTSYMACWENKRLYVFPKRKWRRRRRRIAVYHILLGFLCEDCWLCFYGLYS